MISQNEKRREKKKKEKKEKTNDSDHGIVADDLEGLDESLLSSGLQ
jgi:hypothetical protein